MKPITMIFLIMPLLLLSEGLRGSIQYHNIKQVDILIERLHDDKLFFDQFLHEIAIESTEMFRIFHSGDIFVMNCYS